MSLASFEARLKEIEAAIVQSLANHNALLGRHAELKHLIGAAGSVDPVVESAVEVAESIAE